MSTICLLILLSLVTHTSAMESTDTLPVPATPNIFVWQDNITSTSFIAVGTTATKEPASFAAGDASLNTPRVCDHRQPPADTALTVSLPKKERDVCAFRLFGLFILMRFLPSILLNPSHTSHPPLPTPPPSPIPSFSSPTCNTDEQFDEARWCARHHHSILYHLCVRRKGICGPASCPLLGYLAWSSICDGTRGSRRTHR